jgi:hypothetical protein
MLIHTTDEQEQEGKVETLSYSLVPASVFSSASGVRFGVGESSWPS